jgi:outer membrane protein TolC
MKWMDLEHRWTKILLAAGLFVIATACNPAIQRIDPAPVPTASPSDRRIAATASFEDSEPLEENRLPDGPLALTVEGAILMSLENNRSLVVERLNPAIEKTFEQQEQAVFDPVLGAEGSVGRDKAERLARSGSDTENFNTDTFDGFIDMAQFFPTGTTVAVKGTTRATDSSLYDNTFYATRFGLSVTQAILRGYGTEVNLATLRQAMLDTRFSAYELRGFTEFLVAEVEKTFWDFALARRRIEIFEESLKLARQQLEETRELIIVGRLAEAELPAVQAEVAAQEQGLINARSEMETIHLRLLRLLNPPGEDLWQRKIELIYQPRLPEIELDAVEDSVAVALRMRPVINQAMLSVQRDDLQLVKTRNGLLPLVDLFVTLGKSGYADSFGESFSNLDGDSYDALAGVRFEYPLRNRQADARHQRALLTREQSEKALKNLSQLVEVDVRSAYIEVNRTKQQIAASAATRAFNEEKLRTETEKLRVGRSTSILLAQAQRDLLVSRITEVESLANYLKSLVDLYLNEGSLLLRRGIDAPGESPVTASIR